MTDNDPAYKNWYANCNHMPGPGQERDLRVGGEVRCTSTGWSAELTPTGGNTGSNPLMLHLDLTVTPPPPGEPVQRVITYVPAEWHDESPAFDYDEVKFRRADADPPPQLTVDHLSRSES